MTTCDVAVVGFGPVGATLAALLARRGLSVVAIDKDTDVYPLPRAAHVDHEAMRIWQEVGCAEAMRADTRVNSGMDFVTAGGDVLQRMVSPGLAPTGWPASQMVYQPALEATLRKAAVELGVDTRLGVEVVGLNETTLTLADGSVIDAAWVVGCDGARSYVRKQLGIDLDDLQFEEPWLVIDTVVRGAHSLPRDRAVQVCDPARPQTLVPMPEPRFRFEFMLLAGEAPDAMQDPAIVRELVSRWADPSGVEIERSAVYEFHGLIAREWRRGRVFLAGDAAHQMPPFLGQGMCSGLRDAANLAWKLDLVHRGLAADALLDTYQAEREPHVRTLVELAVGFGRIICTTDAEVAAARDAQMLADRAEPGEAQVFGMVPGPLVASDGRAAPQPHCNDVRFDELAGPRFAVVAREPRLLTDPNGWDALAVMLDAATIPALGPLLDTLGADVAIIRPDRYVLATGPTLAALPVPPLLVR